MSIFLTLQAKKPKLSIELKSIFLLIIFRIQDSDGGFFERFGSMLHARHENIDDHLLLANSAMPPADEVVTSEIIQVQAAAAPGPMIESRIGGTDDDTGKDSGNESAETDSDSEDKKESLKTIQNALVGMNVSGLIKILKHLPSMVSLKFGIFMVIANPVIIKWQILFR